jgi:hypothetical protein
MVEKREELEFPDRGKFLLRVRFGGPLAQNARSGCVHGHVLGRISNGYFNMRSRFPLLYVKPDCVEKRGGGRNW